MPPPPPPPALRTPMIKITNLRSNEPSGKRTFGKTKYYKLEDVHYHSPSHHTGPDEGTCPDAAGQYLPRYACASRPRKSERYEKIWRVNIANPPLWNEKIDNMNIANPPLWNEKIDNMNIANPPLWNEKIDNMNIANPPLWNEKIDNMNIANP